MCGFEDEMYLKRRTNKKTGDKCHEVRLRSLEITILGGGGVEILREVYFLFTDEFDVGGPRTKGVYGRRRARGPDVSVWTTGRGSSVGEVSRPSSSSSSHSGLGRLWTGGVPDPFTEDLFML